ncbi:S8 family peptidase [Thermodesulfobacteriota bacterium B35]
MDYEYTLGNRGNRYRLTTGRMDPGLKIRFNKIEGAPARVGKYRFLIRSTDPVGATSDTWYNLKVIRARLKVTVSPQKSTIARNRAASLRLTWSFSASEEISDTLESFQGIFFAGSRRLGQVNRRISTRMTNGRARLAEQVTVPIEVIRTAQRLGLDEIRYQRTFKARYMDAATTSSAAIAMSTGFVFTRIHIYFDDDRSSKKFVKRNQKGITAAVDLRYEGAGLLKGYWQVDDRILARVTRNLPFSSGRTITLQLPKVPALPTHSTGSHRLRFVITRPAMDIAFPQVIYVVTGEDLSDSHPIQLLTPVAGATLPPRDLYFTWKRRRGVHMYKLEIFLEKKNGPETIYSAFSKKGAYTPPGTLLLKKLSTGSEYSWQVSGLDRNNRVVARSKKRRFTLGSPDLTFVPGRLLLLVDRRHQDISGLLDRLRDRYHLSISMRKPLPMTGQELIVFTTTADVQQLSRKISAENREIVIQPDYIYSTLGKIVETRNRDTILRYLHLDHLATGRGIRVGIIDTGVDLSHPDLAANIVAHANFVEDSIYQAEIHGTAVAGIIGATVNGQGAAGLAPESGLVALRACRQPDAAKAAGRCVSSAIIQALDRAMAEKTDLVNMSIGTSAPDRLVADTIDRVADAGVILLAPAGNDRTQTVLSFPASHTRVISVAGVMDDGRTIPNKNVADQADCTLPAQYVQVTLPGGRVSFMHGTSMASAEATGLLAALQTDIHTLSSCRGKEYLFACLAGK